MVNEETINEAPENVQKITDYLLSRKKGDKERVLSTAVPMYRKLEQEVLE